MGNYVSKSDISNWPSGTSDSEKDAIIEKYEAFLEKITGTHFYEKSFDIYINGNGKNRIFLGLEADIIEITNVYICEIEIPSSWYSWDADSVYLDLCGSGATVGIAWGELFYKIGEAAEGLFPRGYNNIRFVDTYGQTGLKQIAKQVVKTLIEAHNEGGITKGALFESEKIGDYSYKYGGTLYGKVYTGIREVDTMIESLIRDKPIILTP